MCAWIPGGELRVRSGWMPVSALPQRRNVYRSHRSLQVLLPARNSGYEAQQLTDCCKSGLSFQTTGFMTQSLKGMCSFLWRMFPKCTESLEMHIFSLKINAAFFSSSFKGMGHDRVLLQCMISLCYCGWAGYRWGLSQPPLFWCGPSKVSFWRSSCEIHRKLV